MCRYFDATGGATKAIVMFAILPIVYRRLIKGPPNDYLFAAFGLCCNIRTSHIYMTHNLHQRKLCFCDRPEAARTLT